MKRMIVFFGLALCLVLTALPTAAESPNLFFDITEADGLICVTLSNRAMTVKSISGGIRFDTEDLTCLSVTGTRTGSKAAFAYLYDTEGDYYMATATTAVSEANENGAVGFALASAENRSYTEHLLFTVTFEKKEGASGSTDFTLYESSDGLTGYSKNKSTDVETRSFPLTGESPLPGDTDGDGTIDAADLSALARHIGGIAELTGETCLANADTDRDGRVDAADLSSLARHVGGIQALA